MVAHLCDAWRDDAGGRPVGLAVGHVVPAGEPLVRYTVVDRSGRATSRVIRRRFEVADGIRSQGFEPTPSYSACSWCDFRIACPAAER